MDPAPALYVIRINGHLGATLLSAFPAMASRLQGAETVLMGLLDRSALYGVLAEVEALGLDLLEVRQLMLAKALGCVVRLLVSRPAASFGHFPALLGWVSKHSPATIALSLLWPCWSPAARDLARVRSVRPSPTLTVPSSPSVRTGCWTYPAPRAGAGACPAPARCGQGWTGPLGPRSRRSDCMMANVVVVVKTSMSAAASTPVYFAMIGAAARSVTVSRRALTPAQAFSP